MENKEMVTEDGILAILEELGLKSKELKIFKKRIKSEGVEAVIPAILVLEEKRLKKEEEDLRYLEMQKTKAEDEVKKTMNNASDDFDKKFDQQFDKVFSEIESYDEQIKRLDEDEEKELDRIGEETISKIKGLAEKISNK